MKNSLSSLYSIPSALLGRVSVAVLCLFIAGTSASADVIVMFENDELVAGDTSAGTDAVHADASSTALTSAMPASNWPDALVVLQNNGAIDSLADAIASDDYFSFSVTPNAGFTANFSSLDLLYSLGANLQPAATEFSLLSNLTGFTDSDAIDTITGLAPNAFNLGAGVFDISGSTDLQNVAGGSAIEFRVYAHNTGANAMTRIGIGESFATNGNADLQLNGTIVSSVPEPSSLSMLGLGLVVFLRRRRTTS